MSSFTLKHPNSNLTQGTISRLELGLDESGVAQLNQVLLGWVGLLAN